MVTKEQFLCTIQVAAAAQQSWRKGSAVDLRSGATDLAGVKAVPVYLPLCVHAPKHEQQVDKGVFSAVLTQALLEGPSSVTC